jgi:hypothetical protein
MTDHHEELKIDDDDGEICPHYVIDRQAELICHMRLSIEQAAGIIAHFLNNPRGSDLRRAIDALEYAMNEADRFDEEIGEGVEAEEPDSLAQAEPEGSA